MRNPVCLKCENKGTDQLRGYLSLYVRYIERTSSIQSLEMLNPLTIFYCCTARFVSDLVGNPGDRFFSGRGSCNVFTRCVPKMMTMTTQLKTFESKSEKSNI